MRKDFPVIFLDEVDSTNRYALEFFENLDNETLVCALHQTNGRGRNDRRWLSGNGENCCVSWVLAKVSGNMIDMMAAASLAQLKCLRHFAPQLSFGIKWPNDILCNGSKICGILCEAKDCSDGSRGLVVGMGTNLNAARKFISSIDQKATSLYLESGKKYELKKFVLKLAQCLHQNYITHLHSPHSFYDEWKSENLLIGKDVKFCFGNNDVLHGKVIDVAPDGAIVIESALTGSKKYYSGEIHILKE